MSANAMNVVASRWARLGAMFGVDAAAGEVDVERLLLDTARRAPANVRLLILAVTWLARHGEAVAKHRLARLIKTELEQEYRPTMGLVLDLARGADPANATRFNQAIRACGRGASRGMPLSEVERESETLRRLAKGRASAASRKWGRWVETFELKWDALRPAEWVVAHNPSLYERALAGGDLVASVLAECAANGGRVGSEAELARRCGASRPAVHEAVRTLERNGRVRVVARGRAHAIELLPMQIAAA
jgi:hypothetical protein